MIKLHKGLGKEFCIVFDTVERITVIISSSSTILLLSLCKYQWVFGLKDLWGTRF